MRIQTFPRGSLREGSVAAGGFEPSLGAACVRAVWLQEAASLPSGQPAGGQCDTGGLITFS